MENISIRLKQLIDYKKISIREFERKIGASSSLIANAIRKDTDIQSKWLTIIIDTFPDIDAKWLLTGEGEMYVNNYMVNEPQEKYEPNSETNKFAQELKEAKNKISELQEELLSFYRKEKKSGRLAG